MRAGDIFALPGLPFDHWASYLKFSGCQHAFCNVHHLRELLFIHEQYRQTFLACLLRTIKAEVASTSELHTALPPDRLAAYEAEYDAIIGAGFAANPSSVKSRPRPIGRPNSRRPKTCSTAYTNIKLASWPLCTISASPLTTIWSNAMCA